MRDVCAGDAGAGPIARLPPPERFHWLVAPRSTAIRISAVHGGVTEDPAATLRHLFQTLVARVIRARERPAAVDTSVPGG